MIFGTTHNHDRIGTTVGARIRRSSPLWVLAALLGAWQLAQGETLESIFTDAESEELTDFRPRGPEEWNNGWTVTLDNDLFSGLGNDRDYTGGFSVTLHGQRARHLPLSVDRALKWLDAKTRFNTLYPDTAASQYHSMQFGVLLFTPEDITTSEPINDDRPYANLIYVANSQYSVNFDETTVHQSTLTVGFLGTGIGETLQGGSHSIVGTEKTQGYDNQISDGGEPTLRYAVARHKLLSSGLVSSRNRDLKLSVAGSVGYLTEASVGISGRWGRLASPWWVSTSEYGDYSAQPFRHTENRSLGVGRSKERYISAGVKLRLRAYNAFLQGQFRDSAVTFDSSDINHLLLESWAGYTTSIGKGRVSYLVRFQTAEIKHGIGARHSVWAGISVSR